MALHLEAKTAVLAETLALGGAEVAITGCNPLSTQDDVSAALNTRDNVFCFAKYNCTTEEYYAALDKVLDFDPDLTVDDGGDLIFKIHTERPHTASESVGELRRDHYRGASSSGHGSRRSIENSGNCCQ